MEVIISLISPKKEIERERYIYRERERTIFVNWKYH